MTVDNEFTLYLDGRELGRGAEWRELYLFDVTPFMSPGSHTIAVQCFNSSWYAGMLFGLEIDYSDGRRQEIKSDQSWKVVPIGLPGWKKITKPANEWPAVTIVAALGGIPWWTRPDNINVMPTLVPIKIYFWQTGWFQITLLSASGIILLISLRLVGQLALHRKERWLLQQERARIARDIHDDLGSKMTQLVLHGEVAQSELPADSETRAQINVICQDAREVLSTVDEILWAVNPRRDTLQDFISFVCSYAEQYLRSTQIQCLLDVEPEMPASVLNLPVRSSLLMAIKETLHNSVKYSHASELHLQIKWKQECLNVAVVDNGKGFDPANAPAGRSGLTNMRKRMEELGGTCIVTSGPGKGCRVQFEVPLRPSRWWQWNWIWDSRRSENQLRQTKNLQTHEA